VMLQVSEYFVRTALYTVEELIALAPKKQKLLKKSQ